MRRISRARSGKQQSAIHKHSLASASAATTATNLVATEPNSNRNSKSNSSNQGTTTTNTYNCKNTRNFNNNDGGITKSGSNGDVAAVGALVSAVVINTTFRTVHTTSGSNSKAYSHKDDEENNLFASEGEFGEEVGGNRNINSNSALTTKLEHKSLSSTSTSPYSHRKTGKNRDFTDVDEEEISPPLSQNTIVSAQFYGSLPLESSAVALERAYNVCVNHPVGKTFENYKMELKRELTRVLNREANNNNGENNSFFLPTTASSSSSSIYLSPSMQNISPTSQTEGETQIARRATPLLGDKPNNTSSDIVHLHHQQSNRAAAAEEVVAAVASMTPISSIPLTTRLLSTRVVARERWGNALFVGPRPPNRNSHNNTLDHNSLSSNGRGQNRGGEDEGEYSSKSNCVPLAAAIPTFGAIQINERRKAVLSQINQKREERGGGGGIQEKEENGERGEAEETRRLFVLRLRQQQKEEERAVDPLAPRQDLFFFEGEEDEGDLLGLKKGEDSSAYHEEGTNETVKKEKPLFGGVDSVGGAATPQPLPTEEEIKSILSEDDGGGQKEVDSRGTNTDMGKRKDFQKGRRKRSEEEGGRVRKQDNERIRSTRGGSSRGEFNYDDVDDDGALPITITTTPSHYSVGGGVSSEGRRKSNIGSSFYRPQRNIDEEVEYNDDEYNRTPFTSSTSQHEGGGGGRGRHAGKMDEELQQEEDGFKEGEELPFLRKKASSGRNPTPSSREGRGGRADENYPAGSDTSSHPNLLPSSRPNGERFFEKIIISSCQEHAPSHLSGPDRGRYLLQVPLSSTLRMADHHQLAVVGGPNTMRYAANRTIGPLFSHLDAKTDECYTWGLGHEHVVERNKSVKRESTSAVTPSDHPTVHQQQLSENQNAQTATSAPLEESAEPNPSSTASASDHVAPCQKDGENNELADKNNSDELVEIAMMTMNSTENNEARDRLLPTAVKVIVDIMSSPDVPKRGSCGAPNLINEFRPLLLSSKRRECDKKRDNTTTFEGDILSGELTRLGLVPPSSAATNADGSSPPLVALPPVQPASFSLASRHMLSPAVAAIVSYADVVRSVDAKKENKETDLHLMGWKLAEEGGGSQPVSLSPSPVTQTPNPNSTSPPCLADQLYRKWLHDYLLESVDGKDEVASTTPTSLSPTNSTSSLSPREESVTLDNSGRKLQQQQPHNILTNLIPRITQDWESGLSFLKYITKCEQNYSSGAHHSRGIKGPSTTANRNLVASASIADALLSLREKEERIAHRKRSAEIERHVRKLSLLRRNARRSKAQGSHNSTATTASTTRGDLNSIVSPPFLPAYKFVTGSNGKRYLVRRNNYKSLEGQWSLLEESQNCVHHRKGSSGGGGGGVKGDTERRSHSRGMGRRHYLRAHLTQWDNRRLRSSTLMNRFLFACSSQTDLARIAAAHRDGGLVSTSSIFDTTNELLPNREKNGEVTIQTHYRAPPPMPPPVLSPAFVDGLEILSVTPDAFSGRHHLFKTVCAATGNQLWWKFNSMSSPTAGTEVTETTFDGSAEPAEKGPIVIEMKRGGAALPEGDERLSEALLRLTSDGQSTVTSPDRPLLTATESLGERNVAQDAANATTNLPTSMATAHHHSPLTSSPHNLPAAVATTTDIKTLITETVVPRVMAMCVAEGKHDVAKTLFDEYLQRQDKVPALAALSLAAAVGGKRRSWFMGAELLDILSTRVDLSEVVVSAATTEVGSPNVNTSSGKNGTVDENNTPEKQKQVFVAKYFGIILNTNDVEANHWEEGLSFVRSVGIRQLALHKSTMMVPLKLMLIVPPS